ncbi:hypothetical protein, conserved [Eimeria maxima]|uniref:Uncharacterized protein n=1 Tax=Eimeria maxima TaxID=5804 RepID=U6MFF7_EIMMA|nr:hypothetical protein, conserved [Eimeria maxima]CDJ61783.1 hypothetical protein, conserved [Eimeria maxima]
MDALMIVHQLQRLAAEPRPSAAVRAKIPRMALGICYFLEHPDRGVQHQAAGALRLLLQQHKQLVLQAPELKDMLTALQQHTNSDDVVVSECCSASLALLRQDEKEHQQQQQQQQQTEDDTHAEPLESLDLFSVVLGLRGLLRCPTNRSLLNFSTQQQQKQENEGSEQQQQENQGQRVLELLQRDLQLRLVRVWGVSSATVTLNAPSLLKQAAALSPDNAREKTGLKQLSEEGDGVAVVNIRLSRKTQRLQQQLRELRAAMGPLTLLLNSELLQKAPRKEGEGAAEESAGASAPEGSGSSNNGRGDSTASAGLGKQQQQQQQRDDGDGYLDEELRENWGDTEDEHKVNASPAGNAGSGGFSFFSANSALFAQSRFMGGMITPSEVNPEMSAKLRAEKERKAALKTQAQGGIMDKLLGRLGSGARLF